MVSTAFTMAAAVLWAPAPTVSLIDGGRRIKNIARKRSLLGDTPGGRCCLSFPMRTLGLRPCIPWEGEAIQNKIATCSSQTAQAKYFLKVKRLILVVKDIKSIQMSRRTCLGKLARALAYLSFCDLIPAAANWASMRRNQMCGSSSL